MVFFASATSRVVARRIAAGAIGGAMVFGAAGPAMADPPDPTPAPLPPNCTEADFYQVEAGVNRAMSRYLFTHPDINASFTGFKDMHDQLQQYKGANTEAQGDLDRIRQPLTDFANRCLKH